MKTYLDLLQHILDHGTHKNDRTGTGTISVFGYQTRYNLENGFPLVTTKKIHLKSIIHELLWFISGDTNIKYLQDNGVKICDAWADPEGDLGPVYGYQWRNFGGSQNSIKGKDQISEVIENIKKNPDSRRHIVTAWNPKDIESMALPPCHAIFQFYVNDGKLSCQMYQRSADLFLGVPFNIASYSLLTMIIAQTCNLQPYEFIHTFGDAHIYNNHIDQVKLQLSRKPKSLPTMTLNPKIKNPFDFKYEDFKLTNYNPYPRIKAPIAV